MLSVVAMLCVDSVLFTPHNKRDAVLAARSKFTSPDGDHVMLLNIYQAYKAARGSKVPLLSSLYLLSGVWQWAVL